MESSLQTPMEAPSLKDFKKILDNGGEGLQPHLFGLRYQPPLNFVMTMDKKPLPREAGMQKGE